MQTSLRHLSERTVAHFKIETKRELKIKKWKRDFPSLWQSCLGQQHYLRPGSTEPASSIGGIEQTSCFRIVQAVPTARPKILLSPKISLASLVIIVQAQRACRGTRKPKIPPSLIILTTLSAMELLMAQYKISLFEEGEI